MRIELYCVIVVMACLVSGAASALAADVGRDLGMVRERLRASLIELPDTARERLIASANTWLRDVKDDGSWPDQDYADRNRENWKAGRHLSRTLDLAVAGRQPGVAPGLQQRYISAATKALRFWLEADPTNENWWHNEIGVPLLVGHTLVVLGDDAPAELHQRGAELMKRSDWGKWTGQNLVWGTRIQIIRACISGDRAAAAQAFDRMYDEVRIFPGKEEGIKPDMSFYQHGQLLYSGGYGSGFISDTSRLALLARDTEFAMPREKVALLVSYLLDGQAWMVRGHYWDYSVTGREIVRKGKNARSLATPARDLAELDGSRKDELLALAARISGDADAPLLSGNRHFWCADYMAHHRPQWFTSARMYSSRTKNTDPLINGESRKSHYLAEGVTYIMLTGAEYEDIFPAWDWHKIPGATIEQNTPFDPKTVARMGRETFVGGVSDGMYGCATMDLSTGELSAKKSWFFFDEGFVALGAGINCTTGNEVVTTLNQCLRKGEVITPDGALDDGEHNLDTPWMWHADVGYVPLASATLRVRNGLQKGAWREIASGSSPDPVERDVMLAYIDHGARPTSAEYAYVVLPGTTAQQTAELARQLPFEVIRNTAALQAVRHPARSITQAIFRKGGRVQAVGFDVTVDQPCALIVRDEGNDVLLSFANPAGTALEVVVTINATLEAQGAVQQSDGGTLIRVSLPGEEDAGRTVTVVAKRSKKLN